MTASSPALSTPHRDQIVKGIIFAVIAFFLLAAMNAMAKIMSDEHHVVEIAFYRNLFAVIPFLLYIGVTRQFHLFRTKTPKALAFRSVLGIISLVTTFAAFKALPMAETTVLLFTASLMLPALSFFILKEAVGIYRWGAIIVGLCGVFVMAGPSGLSNWWGAALALCAAFMHAMLGIALRYMKGESPITVTFYFVLSGMFLTGLFMPLYATIPTGEEWLMFIAIGMSGAGAQVCLAYAYKNAPASVVTIFNYTGLIWATGFDIILWQSVPAWTVFFGGSIVIGSSLFITYREKLSEERQKT